MSLAPKVDEIAFTETWLRETAPDISIDISHYQLYRRDRINRLHGGVCLYVKDSIHCNILKGLNHSDHEFLWANLRPKCLPRGISNIIVAVVYQPPASDNAAMKNYLILSLEILEVKYPNCAIILENWVRGCILTGDFNKMLLPLLQPALKVFYFRQTTPYLCGNCTISEVIPPFMQSSLQQTGNYINACCLV